MAKEAVASLMVTANDTSEIMQLLQLRFGNPTAVASRIIVDLKALPKTYEVGIEFVKFAITVKNVVAALEATKHVGYLHSPELMREITQKISAGMIYNFNKYLHEKGNSEDPALVTLSKFLFFEAEIACKAGILEPLPSTSQPKRLNNKQEPDRSRGFKQKIEDTKNNYRSKTNTIERVCATIVEGGDDSTTAERAKHDLNCGYCQSNSQFLHLFSFNILKHSVLTLKSL